MKPNNSSPAKKAFNIYEMVTKRILQHMMKGEIPWRNTYSLKKQTPDYYNAVTGKPYSFLNGLLLGKPGAYATLRQINAAGGRVKKGSKSSFVVFWGSFIPKEDKELAKRLKEEGKDTSHLEVWFLKGYNNVYSTDDVEGVTFDTVKQDESVMQRAESPTDIADMITRDYASGKGVGIVNDNASDPVYDLDKDTVILPEKERFILEEDYYAALFENLVHSTATEGRLNRKRELASLEANQASAKEGLIADIAASMLLATAGLQRKETEQQTAAQCQKWIEEMNRNYRLIVEASTGAEKAARYILGKYAAKEETDTEETDADTTMAA